MPKPFHPKILTANHLVEGDAVWWTGVGWSRALSEALVAATPDAAQDLTRLAGRPALEAQVVGPYLVDVALDRAAPPRPLLRREAIRADRSPTFAYVADQRREAA